MTPKQIWPTHTHTLNPSPLLVPPLSLPNQTRPTPKPITRQMTQPSAPNPTQPLTFDAPFWRHPPTLHFWQHQFSLDLDTKTLPFGFFCPIIKATILVIIELYILWYVTLGLGEGKGMEKKKKI